jgi:6,7-dimethyl-8-ribityllumazine synthase
VDGEDFVDEADAEGFGGRDHLSGEEEFEGCRGADQTGEPLGSTVTGDEAEFDFGLAETGGFAGEAEGAGHGELAAASEGEAVDAGDDGFAAGFDEAEDLLAAAGLGFAGGGVERGEFGDVGPGGEGFFAGSGEEDDAHVRVCGEGHEDGFKFVEDSGVEGVEDVRAIEGYLRYLRADFTEQGLVVHGISCGMRRVCGGAGSVRFHRRYNRTMIKGITLVTAVGLGETPGTEMGAEFDRLNGLFSSLGFEQGKGWDETIEQGGGAGRGAAFLAPIGNVEFVTGRLPAVPPVLVEVSNLEAVHAVVKQWLLAVRRTEEVAVLLSEPELTHWNSRLFTAQLTQGLKVGFWQSENVLHGRPDAVEGDLSAAGARFAIVTTRWNTVITDRLLQGSLDALHRSGAAKKDIEIVRVPGAWEVPSAARTLAESKRFDAIITLGCLLRGETAHYEAIYNEVARGIGQSQQDTGVPHAFGVLTCETLEQALDRAGLKAGNKGFDAAIAAIEMVSIQRKLGDAGQVKS